MESQRSITQIESVESLNRSPVQKPKKRRKKHVSLVKDVSSIKLKRPTSPFDAVPADLQVVIDPKKKPRYASQLEVETMQEEYRTRQIKKMDVMTSHRSLLFSDDGTQINMDIEHTLDPKNKDVKRMISGGKLINFNITKKKPINFNTNVLSSKLFSMNLDTKINQEVFSAFQYQKKLLAAAQKRKHAKLIDSTIQPIANMLQIVSTSLTPTQEDSLSPRDQMTQQNSLAMLFSDEDQEIKPKFVRLKKINQIDIQAPQLPQPKVKTIEKMQLAKKLQAIQHVRTERAKQRLGGFAFKGSKAITVANSRETEYLSPREHEVSILSPREHKEIIMTPISQQSFYIDKVQTREPSEQRRSVDHEQSQAQNTTKNIVQIKEISSQPTEPSKSSLQQKKFSYGGMIVDVFLNKFVKQFVPASPRVTIPVRISIDQIAQNNNPQTKTPSIRKSHIQMPQNSTQMWEKSVVPTKHLTSKKLHSKPRPQSILSTNSQTDLVVDLKHTVELHNRNRLSMDVDNNKRPSKERGGYAKHLDPVRYASQMEKLPILQLNEGSLKRQSSGNFDVSTKNVTRKTSVNNEADKTSNRRLQLPVININADQTFLNGQAFQSRIQSPIELQSLKYPDHFRSSTGQKNELQNLIRQSLERLKANARLKDAQKIGLATLMDPSKLFNYQQLNDMSRNIIYHSMKSPTEGLIKSLSPRHELHAKKQVLQKLKQAETAMSKVNLRVSQISDQLETDISTFIKKKTLATREEAMKARLENYEKKVSMSLRVSIPMKGHQHDDSQREEDGESPLPWSPERSRSDLHQIF